MNYSLNTILTNKPDSSTLYHELLSEHDPDKQTWLFNITLAVSEHDLVRESEALGKTLKDRPPTQNWQLRMEYSMGQASDLYQPQMNNNTKKQNKEKVDEKR